MSFSSEVTVIMVISLLIIMAVILTGNIMVLVTFYKPFCTRTLPPSLFLISLAITDLILGLTLPFTIMTLLNSRRWFLGDFMCQLAAYLNLVCGILSIHTLAAIAYDRYMTIQSFRRRRVRKSKRTVFLLTFIWIFALSIGVGPLVGWGKYGHIQNDTTCKFDFNSSRSFTFVLVITGYIIPLIVMIICYSHVYYVVRKVSKSVAPLVYVQPLSKVIAHREAKTLFVCLIMVFAFLLCWSPFAIIHMLYALKWPVGDEWRAVTSWLAAANSGCNPLIYIFTNVQFRRAILYHVPTCFVVRRC